MKSTQFTFTFVLVVSTFFLFQFCAQQEVPNNTLSKKEKQQGFVLLFDGKTTNGWRGYNRKTFPETGWKVENGELRCLPSERGEAGNGGDIVTEKKYSNFELKLEWKIEKAGNSGLMFLVQELEAEPSWHSGPELQILDGKNFPMELSPSQLSGSAYDLIPADPQNVKPFGEWNRVRLIVNNKKVEHWQNGAKVAAYEIGSDKWNKLVQNSKFKEYPEFAAADEGYICLQDHGSDVRFRNIKIREL